MALLETRVFFGSAIIEVPPPELPCQIARIIESFFSLLVPLQSLPAASKPYAAHVHGPRPGTNTCSANLNNDPTPCTPFWQFSACLVPRLRPREHGPQLVARHSIEGVQFEKYLDDPNVSYYYARFNFNTWGIQNQQLNGVTIILQ